MTSYIGALDQGTTSTRFMVFDRSGAVVSAAQREHSTKTSTTFVRIGRRIVRGPHKMDAASRETMYRNWKKAVTRSFDWLDPAP